MARLNPKMSPRIGGVTHSSNLVYDAMDLGGIRIQNIGSPTANMDSCNKRYADEVAGSGTVSGLTVDANKDWSTKNITNVGTIQAAEGSFTVANIGSLDYQLDAFGNKIVNIGTPSAVMDAANKRYVDESSGNLSSLTIDANKTWAGKDITNIGTIAAINGSITTLNADLNAGAKTIRNIGTAIITIGSVVTLTIGTPTANMHAANKLYVDENASSSGIWNNDGQKIGGPMNPAADNTYEDLDIGSAITAYSSGTIVVMIKIDNDGGTAGIYGFRPNGDAHIGTLSDCSGINNIYNLAGQAGLIIVPTDASGIFEWMLQTRADRITHMWLVGYWM